MIFPSLIIKIERWKFNKDYGVYVSNLGNFKDRHKRRLPVKINESGYCCIKTEQGFKLGHRLVMLTWRPIPDSENLTVDHLNHNKRDNSIQNLEWVTKKENIRRAELDCIKHQKKKKKTELPKVKKDERIVFYVNERMFLDVNEALSYIKRHLTSDLGSYDENRARRIFETRALNIDQVCKYCGYSLKATKKSLEDISKEAKGFNTIRNDPSRLDLTSKKTQELIKEEEDKAKKVEEKLSEILKDKKYSFKVNSKNFGNAEEAFEYATTICKKIFLNNLDFQRVKRIYAKATMTPGRVTSFCGIDFSIIKN